MDVLLFVDVTTTYRVTDRGDGVTINFGVFFGTLFFVMGVIDQWFTTCTFKIYVGWRLGVDQGINFRYVAILVGGVTG